ncbi:MAG: histidine phosphatase family protein [Microthrixaceae bacterium]
MSSWRNDESNTTALLVRHGRTVVNAQARLSGHHDPDLDDVGRAQASALGVEIAGRCSGHITIVSSPLGRCVQTAESVAAACGLDADSLSIDERFIEVDYGEWDGRPLEDVPVEVWRQWRNDPAFCPPGGETLASVTERVAAGLEHWAPLAAGGTLVVVSHVSPIKAGVIWALGVGEAATWRMRLDNASICRLSVSGGRDGRARGGLGSFNETTHLPPP